MMSINILMKDFLSVKNLVRGMAIRTLAHAFKPELKDQVINIINKGVKDKSAFVRRICILGLYKIYYFGLEATDESTIKDLSESISLTFKDFPSVSGLAFI
jgi:vesicle coat complex subunit